MNARYTFGVTFRLDPDTGSVNPDVFETTLSRPAAPPGEPGWLFFRDNLWRGDITDKPHLRRETATALGVDVIDIEYTAFVTDAAYWTAFREAIGDDLEQFRAESIEAVINKYLGSSVERRD